jgi:hypothetical protein
MIKFGAMESRFRRSLPLSDLCQEVVVMVNNYLDMRTFCGRMLPLEPFFAKKSNSRTKAN